MMTLTKTRFVSLAFAMLLLPFSSWAEDKDTEGEDKKLPLKESEFELGFYSVDENSYRYGKYTGLREFDNDLLLNFKLKMGTEWNADETYFLNAEGSRMMLDSRRLLIEAAAALVADIVLLPALLAGPLGKILQAAANKRAQAAAEVCEAAVPVPHLAQRASNTTPNR